MFDFIGQIIELEKAKFLRNIILFHKLTGNKKEYYRNKKRFYKKYKNAIEFPGNNELKMMWNLID